MSYSSSPFRDPLSEPASTLGIVPELPEIQALAERIDGQLAGARLVRVEPLSFSGLKTVLPSPSALDGTPLAGVGRRGKYLVFDFDTLRLLVHLSQGGRVELQSGDVSSRPKGGVVRLRFDRDPAILVKEFGTERKAGWWVLEASDEGPLAKLGPDALSEEFRSLVLTGRDSGRIHAMLRDQRVVAGIGRGYADDILHRAKLSPYRSLISLDASERDRLVHAVEEVLGEAIEIERRRPAGLPPKLGDHFTVHGRSGTPCPACGTELRRVSYQSHEVTYCPACQTGGRRYNDRRMDRLIR
jgi:formamidopyrimidine-DNA glycosylase